MLCWEVEQNGVNVAHGLSPDFGENIGHNNKYTVRGYHQEAPTYINDEKDQNEVCRILLVLHHEVLDLLCVEEFKKDNEADYEANYEKSQYVDTKPVGEGSCVE